MITLITCTGGRPDAWALCRNMIFRQEGFFPNIQWIVVNDVDDDRALDLFYRKAFYRPGVWLDLIVPDKKWQPGENTQAANMLAALKKVRGDIVFVIEDDDWYAPDFLAKLHYFIEHRVDCVGLANALYYNVYHRSYKWMHNQFHSSLCCTAFRSHLIPLLQQAIHSGDKFFDVTFWSIVSGQERIKNMLIHEDKPCCVGIKGLPGRPGIGVGHIAEGFTPDPSMEVAFQYLGKDASNYVSFYKEGTQDASVG